MDIMLFYTFRSDWYNILSEVSLNSKLLLMTRAKKRRKKKTKIANAALFLLVMKNIQEYLITLYYILVSTKTISTFL